MKTFFIFLSLIFTINLSSQTIHDNTHILWNVQTTPQVFWAKDTDQVFKKILEVYYKGDYLNIDSCVIVISGDTTKMIKSLIQMFNYQNKQHQETVKLLELYEEELIKTKKILYQTAKDLRNLNITIVKLLNRK